MRRQSEEEGEVEEEERENTNFLFACSSPPVCPFLFLFLLSSAILSLNLLVSCRVGTLRALQRFGSRD